MTGEKAVITHNSVVSNNVSDIRLYKRSYLYLMLQFTDYWFEIITLFSWKVRTFSHLKVHLDQTTVHHKDTEKQSASNLLLYLFVNRRLDFSLFYHNYLCNGHFKHISNACCLLRPNSGFLLTNRHRKYNTCYLTYQKH